MSSVRWRNATANDMPTINRLLDEQESRFKEIAPTVKVGRPDLSQPPTMCVRVAEKEGQVVGFYHVEAVAEFALCTGNEEVMKSLPREMAVLSHWLKSVGIRTGWGLVPKRFSAVLGRFLKPFPLIRKWMAFDIYGCDFTELGD